MMSQTLVVNCGELVTMAGPSRARSGHELREIGLLRDVAMLIENGRVLAVGTYAELRAKSGASTHVIDAEGRLVTPGFVDAHTHPVFSGNRIEDFERRISGMTYQEIAAVGGGISSTLAMTRDASHDELVAAGLNHARWMLRSGTTTAEAKSGYGLSVESELKLLRVIRDVSAESPLRMIPTFLGAHTVPSEYRSQRDAYVRMILEEMLPQVVQEKLAEYCDVFCDAHAFDLHESEQILRAASALGLRLRVHVEQFAADGGAAMAARLGAKTADHLEATERDGMKALLEGKVQPVLVPASVFALGLNKYADARAMIEVGLAPVLATDFNPGSSPTTSMPFVMSLAALYMQMLPSESMTAATMNAAASLGLQDEIGSLEQGKRADFVIHEAQDYRELAYFLSAQVRPRVFVRGEEVA